MNQAAARLVQEIAGKETALPAGLEEAWADWSKGIQGIDERTWTVLRVAFEAGAESALGLGQNNKENKHQES